MSPITMPSGPSTIIINARVPLPRVVAPVPGEWQGVFFRGGKGPNTARREKHHDNFGTVRSKRHNRPRFCTEKRKLVFGKPLHVSSKGWRKRRAAEMRHRGLRHGLGVEDNHGEEDEYDDGGLGKHKSVDEYEHEYAEEDESQCADEDEHKDAGEDEHEYAEGDESE